MKRFRTILIPLLLCALVLAAGFGLPALFGRAVPDYKNAPEPIAIAGKESPLYLEDDTDIALPPWDAVAAGGSSVLLSDYLGAAQIDGDFVNDYIRSLVGLFAAVPAEDENFLSALRVLDGTLLYLRGYTYTATDGEQYTLGLVLDNSAALPLSVHVRPLSDKTHPAASPDLLLSAFQEAFQFWKTQLSERPEIYTADKDARMLCFRIRWISLTARAAGAPRSWSRSSARSSWPAKRFSPTAPLGRKPSLHPGTSKSATRSATRTRR